MGPKEGRYRTRRPFPLFSFLYICLPPPPRFIFSLFPLYVQTATQTNQQHTTTNHPPHPTPPPPTKQQHTFSSTPPPPALFLPINARKEENWIVGGSKKGPFLLILPPPHSPPFHASLIFSSPSSLLSVGKWTIMGRTIVSLLPLFFLFLPLFLHPLSSLRVSFLNWRKQFFPSPGLSYDGGESKGYDRSYFLPSPLLFPLPASFLFADSFLPLSSPRPVVDEASKKGE